MTDAKDTLDEAAMVRLGRRLQEARLAMGYSTGGLAPSLMAARTQLEDIEAGRMGTFYSDHYYLSLYRRYAAFLKFSPEVIEDMVRELRGEALPPAPEDKPADDSQDDPQDEPADEPADDPEPPVVPVVTEPTVPPQTEPLSQPSAPKRPPSSSGLGDRLLALLALIAVAAVAWVLISEQGSGSASSPVTAPLVESAPAPANAPAPAPTPAMTPAVETPPVASPASPPASENTPAPSAAASSTQNPGTDALVLQFPEKSWIWVRRADDTVSEVGVPAGTSLRFEEMPIYIVLPRPGEIQVTVRGRKVALQRNDAERDMGRFTRTMLEQATTR
ncbi:MAG: helix-turn-helix domain-containing protein [Burkholderiaceae bacterium]